VKIAKMIGLAAIAALALTASLGAGSALASATALCKSTANNPYCTAANTYPGGTELKASSSTAKVEGKAYGGIKANFECTESALEGKTVSGSGEPLPVSVSAWTLGGCKLVLPESGYTIACTATAVESAPYSGSLSWTSGTNGTLAIGSGGKGNPGWKFKCTGFFPIDCTLSFAPSLDVSGGSPATIVASSESMSGSGSPCLEKGASFTGTYSVASPKPVYPAKPTESLSGPTALCKISEGKCPAGQLYPKGTAIKAETSALTINATGGAIAKIACTHATLSAETTAASGEPLPISATSFEQSGCTVSASSGETLGCSLSAVSGSAGTINWSAGRDGLWEAPGAGWKTNCGEGSPGNCSYTLKSGSPTLLEGGNPALITAKEVSLNIDKPGYYCGFTATLTSTFNVTSPKPVFVTKS